MKTIEELELEVEARFHILVNAIIFYKGCKYLNNPKTDEEKNKAEKSIFIRKTRYAFWVLSVLELNKLYGKYNDHFTFEKLFNKLLTGYNSAPWNPSLSMDKLQLWKESLENEETKRVIKKLHGLRDQYYAHSDRNPGEDISSLTPEFKQVEKLIDFGKEVLFEIRSKVFDVHQLFETPDMGTANNILRNMIELENFRNNKTKTERQ